MTTITADQQDTKSPKDRFQELYALVLYGIRRKYYDALVDCLQEFQDTLQRKIAEIEEFITFCEKNRNTLDTVAASLQKIEREAVINAAKMAVVSAESHGTLVSQQEVDAAKKQAETWALEAQMARNNLRSVEQGCAQAKQKLPYYKCEFFLYQAVLCSFSGEHETQQASLDAYRDHIGIDETDPLWNTAMTIFHTLWSD